jgi:ABC-type branched-subunit amino acid transport system ATPase component
VTGAASLAAAGIVKRFAGLVALDAVSLDLRPGEIQGLIGPNGSGKTTMLNMLSGYYQPTDGRITLDGTDISELSVQTRARSGIARTFQKPRLLTGLSVLDNAMLGAWRDVRAGFVETALAFPRVRREEQAFRAHAAALLRGVGLGHALERPADRLEHAEQRFLEIARALVSRPRFLLLDEPAGGLTGAEIESLGRIIMAVRDSGIGVLLVEHHTDFVFRISARVITLDRGRLIAHGTPDQVRQDPEVVRVYLGA